MLIGALFIKSKKTGNNPQPFGLDRIKHCGACTSYNTTEQ